jgi:hypothetical protein
LSRCDYHQAGAEDVQEMPNSIEENRGECMSEAIVIALAQTKLIEVETLAAKLGAAETLLEAGYGQLAFLLKEVRDNKYWVGTYDNFGDFILHLRDTHNLGKSQLYKYMFTATELGALVTPEQLSAMGISKAVALSDIAAKDGTISDAVLAAAADPKVTVKDLKKLLFEANNTLPPEEGEWLDCGFEFYATTEERALLNAAANAARHTDPVTSETLAPFMQLKDILLKWAGEYYGAHAANEVEGDKGL